MKTYDDDMYCVHFRNTAPIYALHTIKAVDNLTDTTRDIHTSPLRTSTTLPNLQTFRLKPLILSLTHHITPHTSSNKTGRKIKILMIVSGRYIEPALYMSNAICTKMPLRKTKRKRPEKRKRSHATIPSHRIPQIKNATKQTQNRPIYE